MSNLIDPVMFDVVVKKLLGTVELSAKYGRTSPEEAAFGLIGKAVADGSLGGLPLEDAEIEFSIPQPRHSEMFTKYRVLISAKAIDTDHPDGKYVQEGVEGE